MTEQTPTPPFTVQATQVFHDGTAFRVEMLLRDANGVLWVNATVTQALNQLKPWKIDVSAR